MKKIVILLVLSMIVHGLFGQDFYNYERNSSPEEQTGYDWSNWDKLEKQGVILGYLMGFSARMALVETLGLEEVYPNDYEVVEYIYQINDFFKYLNMNVKYLILKIDEYYQNSSNAFTPIYIVALQIMAVEATAMISTLNNEIKKKN